MHELTTDPDPSPDCQCAPGPRQASIPAPRRPDPSETRHRDAGTVTGPTSGHGGRDRVPRWRWIGNLVKAMIWCPGLTMVAMAANPRSGATLSIGIAAGLAMLALAKTALENWLNSREHPSTDASTDLATAQPPSWLPLPVEQYKRRSSDAAARAPAASGPP